MWGWKTVERSINNDIPFDDVKKYIIHELNFFEKEINDSYSIFKRSGTQLTFKGDKFPIELALGKTDHGCFFQLRYDGFALFDTGDLSMFADKIVESLTKPLELKSI